MFLFTHFAERGRLACSQAGSCKQKGSGRVAKTGKRHDRCRHLWGANRKDEKHVNHEVEGGVSSRFPPFFGWNPMDETLCLFKHITLCIKTCNNKIVWCFCAQSLPSVPSRYDWKICHKFAVCLLFYAILSFTHGNTSFKKNKYGNFYKFKKNDRKAHRLMNVCPLGWSLFVELEWEEKYHVVFPSKSLQDIYFQYISLLYQLNPQKQKCTITV